MRARLLQSLRHVALAVLAAAAGCGEADCKPPRTDVWLDAEAGALEGADEVRVVVLNDEQESVLDRIFPLRGEEAFDLPLRIELSPRGGVPSRRYQLRADLLDAEGMTLQRVRALAGYEQDACAELRLRFDAACRGQLDCDDGESCVEGECVSACREPAVEVDEPRSPPVACPPTPDCLDVIAMDQGAAYGCAVTRDGRGYCWGDNEYGQQGLRTCCGRDPIAPPAQVGTSKVWMELAAGHTSTTSLKGSPDGPEVRLWTAGDNTYGQLGLDDRPPEPSSMGSDYFHAVRTGVSWTTTGARHACAIGDDPTDLFCWGDNDRGQRGGGDPDPTNVAVQVDGGAERWARVSAGFAHTCAIGEDGSLWCWGANDHGQLGVGAGGDQDAPARVGDEADWVDVRAGGTHTCGLRQGGSLWCWGANDHGQLGLGSTGDGRDEPVRVGDRAGWAAVDVSERDAGGQVHSCAIREDDEGHRTLWCWGANGHGQLGPGDASASPRQVGVGSDWSEVRVGARHSCGLDARARLLCWGDNRALQLGFEGVSETVEPKRVCPVAD